MQIEKNAENHPKNRPGVILPETLVTMSTLPKGSRILDIGCAEGHTIEWLREFFPNKYKYIGIDLSKTRIKKAQKQNVQYTEYCVGHAEDLPLENESVDFVLASQVIEHVPNDTKMLQEVNRVLAPGGGFQIDTVYKKKWAWYIYRSPNGWAIDPTHVREYTNIGSLISKFPSSLLVNSTNLVKSYRRLNILSVISFLPDWFKIRIPGSLLFFS